MYSYLSLICNLNLSLQLLTPSLSQLLIYYLSPILTYPFNYPLQLPFPYSYLSLSFPLALQFPGEHFPTFRNFLR